MVKKADGIIRSTHPHPHAEIGMADSAADAHAVSHLFIGSPITRARILFIFPQKSIHPSHSVRFQLIFTCFECEGLKFKPFTPAVKCCEGLKNRAFTPKIAENQVRSGANVPDGVNT